MALCHFRGINRVGPDVDGALGRPPGGWSHGDRTMVRGIVGRSVELRPGGHQGKRVLEAKGPEAPWPPSQEANAEEEGQELAVQDSSRPSPRAWPPGS